MNTATDGEWTDAIARKTLRALTDYQTANGLSDVAMARILGIGDNVGARSRWNRIKRGSYPTSGTTDVLRRGRDVLAAMDARLAEATAEYVETSIGRRILAVCRRALQRQTIGLIVTRSGMGKTTGLREFSRQRGYQAVYLQAGEACACKGELVREIARQLGLKHGLNDRFSACYELVRHRFAGLYAGGRGAAAMLLVDEATTLRPDSMNFLRNLHDDPATRLSLVFADTWRLIDELYRTGRLPGGYEQLRSRAGAQCRIAAGEAIEESDVRAVAGSVLRGLGCSGRISAASVRYLARIAEMDGGLRNVAQRLGAVADVADAAGVPATYDVGQLDQVADLCGMEPENPGCASAFGDGAPAPARRSAG